MKIKLGILLGLVFGVLDVLIMIPISMPDKIVAMAGAFFGRFAIGFCIPNMNLPVPSWAKGLIVGLLLSLPDAIITNAYGPILGIGGIGGLVIGIVSGKFEKKRQ